MELENLLVSNNKIESFTLADRMDTACFVIYFLNKAISSPFEKFLF